MASQWEYGALIGRFPTLSVLYRANQIKYKSVGRLLISAPLNIYAEV
jgi:hypothetical protein